MAREQLPKQDSGGEVTDRNESQPGGSFRLGLQEALARLPAPGGARFASILDEGTALEVEIYAPRGIDPQRPHRRDELYVVVSGSGFFRLEETRERFGPGDLLLAPARAVHRFEEFSDDLVVWVFFYGAEK